MNKYFLIKKESNELQSQLLIHHNIYSFIDNFLQWSPAKFKEILFFAPTKQMFSIRLKKAISSDSIIIESNQSPFLP